MKLPTYQIRTISSYERLEDVLNKGADDPDYEVFQVLPADGIFRDRIILKRKTTLLTKPVRKSYSEYGNCWQWWCDRCGKHGDSCP